MTTTELRPRTTKRRAQQGFVGVAEKIKSNDFGELELILKKERARADRSGETFSHLLISCEQGSAAFLNELTRIIFNRVRFTDEVRNIQSDRIAVILPNTSAEGARTLANAISAEIGGQAKIDYQIYVYPQKTPLQMGGN